MADDPEAYLEDGRDLLREVAAPLGLWAAYAAADAGLPEPARRKALLGVIDATAARLRQITVSFGRKAMKRIPAVAAWAKSFVRNLGAGHMAGLMAATGTIDPAPADVVIVGKEIERQAGFLAKFRKQIAKGAVVLGSLVGPTGSPLPPSTPAASRPVSARVLSRAEMYADAIWGGTHAVLRSRMIRDGYDEEMRLLGGASNHCGDCPPLAGKWASIGTLPGIGESRCGPRCRCSFTYRHRATGREVVPIGPHDPPPPQSVPRPYGPSPVAPSYPDGYSDAQRRETERLASATLGIPAAVRLIPGLVGAPAGSRVVVQGHNGYLKVEVFHPDFEATRYIGVDPKSGKPTIRNDSFFVRPGSQGRGIGAEVFGRQVEQASAAGIARIETTAAKGEGINGYITWPRFGYDATLPKAVRASLPDAFRDAKRVSDLMRSPEGRAAWKEHGVELPMTFDLREGSRNRLIWDAYRVEKERRR